MLFIEIWTPVRPENDIEAIEIVVLIYSRVTNVYRYDKVNKGMYKYLGRFSVH